MEITKAVIPAAGLGTRFLPFTKTVPKEMLPLLEKPAIQYIIEESLAAGIKTFSLVTSSSKYALENYFDADPGLERAMKEKEKFHLLAGIEKILRTAQFTYVRQPEPLGLGHAIWTARHMIKKEYFGILLPDELFISQEPGLKQIAQIARQEKATVIAVQEVPMECVSSYGIVAVKKQVTPKLFQVSHLIEKPNQQDAPSNLAIIGRYIVSHKIFESLEQISPYAEGELQLTDGLGHMLKHGEKVFAYKMNGLRYDIGKPLGWLTANIGMALHDPRYASQIRAFLSETNITLQPTPSEKEAIKKQFG